MGFTFGVAPAEFGLLGTGLADFLRQIKNINRGKPEFSQGKEASMFFICFIWG